MYILVNDHAANKNKLETGIIPVSSLLCGKQNECALKLEVMTT